MNEANCHNLWHKFLKSYLLSRMGFVPNAAEVVGFDVGVDLGGGDALVIERCQANP